MRRHHGVSKQKSVKPDTCTERDDVYPTRISVKVGVQYPGRSAPVLRFFFQLLTLQGEGRLVQKSAEGIVGRKTEGRNNQHRE
jgi:hypothetical protein